MADRPESGNKQVTVRVETEVVLDINVMAKAFANMGSDEQAEFLALAYQEMGMYTKEQPDGTLEEQGSMGREMQMAYVAGEFDKQPDARAFIHDFYEMSIEQAEEPMHATNWDAQEVDPTFQPCCGAMWEEDHKIGCANRDDLGVTMSDQAKRYYEQQAKAAHNFANMRMVISARNVDVRDGKAYIKGGAGLAGAYVGTVVDEDLVKDTVTIDMAPGTVQPYDPDRLPTGPTWTAEVSRGVKPGELLTADDIVSPVLSPPAPNESFYDYNERMNRLSGKRHDVEPTCDECQGTGWYTGLNSKEPCSRGCKP